MRKITIFIISVFIFSINLATAKSEKTICGNSDERVLSYDQKVGRLLKVASDNRGCSATMIGTACAITAGHCHNYIKILEFNVEYADGSTNNPEKLEENLYVVDSNSVLFKNDKISDWAIFKVFPNTKTGKLPGELYGYHDVSFWSPMRGTTVSITGYGLDAETERSALQQISLGDVTEIEKDKARLRYLVDTRGGNSGAAVISQRSGKIVAIHTNGGCDGRGNSNFGTLLSKSPYLKKAIQACLRSESLNGHLGTK